MVPHHTVGSFTQRIGEELQEPAIQIGNLLRIGKTPITGLYLVDTSLLDDILPE